jgi:hypothetical protein
VRASSELIDLPKFFEPSWGASPVRKFVAWEREAKFVSSITSAVTGTSPHMKERASPDAKSTSSTYIDEIHNMIIFLS